MTITPLSVLLTVSCVLLFSDSSAQIELFTDTVEAEIGLSRTLRCRMKNPSELCTWHHNHKTYYTSPENTFEDGYSVVGNLLNGSCDLKINSVRMVDNGQWDCSMPHNDYNKRVNLVVVKKPTHYFLEYNGRQLANGTTISVPINSLTVQVACAATGSNLKVNITWEGEGIIATDYSQESTDESHNGTFDTRSLLTLRVQKNGKWKTKTVTCMITYSKRNESSLRITTNYVTEHETKEVFLKTVAAADKNEIILSCKADGIPEPKYHIVMTSPRNETLDDHQGRTRRVTKEGTFACLAGNYMNTELIKSSEQHISLPYNDNGLKDELDLSQIGIIVAINLAVLAIIIMAGGVIYHFCRKKRSKGSSRTTLVENCQIDVEPGYDGLQQTLCQNENPKEVIYAKVDLTKKHGAKKSEVPPEQVQKSEYEQIILHSRSTQV